MSPVTTSRVALLVLALVISAGCARGVAVEGAGGTSSTSGSGTTSGNTGPGATTAVSNGTGTSATVASGTSTGGGCAGNAQCASGQACIGGMCGPCSSPAQCDPGDGCVSGVCGACQLSSQCPSGTVCDFGQCLAGTEVQMYQCPGVTSLGGGAWGFYGCQNQITNTATCNEIEAPTTQSFPCTAVGKLAIVTTATTPPPGTTFVDMYQCPGVTTLGGGSWGFYGCQNQITNTATCNEIEFPTTKNFNCMPIGKMTLSTAAPSPPPGGMVVPMYQCPGVTSLGGGSWGFYGCQNQITNTPTCNEIEFPTTQNFPCTAAGSMMLTP